MSQLQLVFAVHKSSLFMIVDDGSLSCWGTVLGLKTIALTTLNVFTFCMIIFGDACLVERAPSTVVHTR